jgi:hypothetical protein
MSDTQLLIYKEKQRNNSLGIKNSFYGKQHSDKSKKLMSNSQKNLPKEKCNYCGLLASKANIARWHNNKCKNL